MGKNNRARRAAKNRKHDDRRATTPPRFHSEARQSHTTDSAPRAAASPTLAERVWAAAHAFGVGHPIYREVVAVLSTLPGGGAAVDEQLALVASNLLARGGWLPADIARIAALKLDAEHAARAARITASSGTWLAAGNPCGERWAASLAAVVEAAATSGRTGDGVSIGVELLSVLAGLPRLPVIEPPPGAAQPRRSRSTTAGRSGPLDKVRALLAKAESTTFPEEADALVAKAQELIARYSIDESLLADGDPDTKPTAVRVWIDDPYSDAKASLIGVVAAANGGRTVWSSGLGFSTVFGFEHDLAAIELLYTSLIVQAVAEMMRAGTVRDWSGTSRTRSFRRSFLEAFAQRIGHRLRAARDAGVTAASDEVGASRLLPVLTRRDNEVEETLRSAFPALISRRSSRQFNAAGWAAGTTAAELAHLGPRAAALDAP